MLIHWYVFFHSYPPKWGSSDMDSRVIIKTFFKKRKHYIMNMFSRMKYSSKFFEILFAMFLLL